MDERHEVVVIGGGQAGLAMGHHLARQRRRFAIVDASPRPGDSWRARWDSLTLFTPARYSGLPGLPFPGDPERCPVRDEVASYLEQYAAAFSLPVRLDEPVVAVRPLPGRGFRVETAKATLAADQVVVATGAFQLPAVPAAARGLDPEVVQVHSGEYRNPARLADGPVLVVGGGNSGVQIAAELAATRPTTLALGEPLPVLPLRLLGRSVFWWLEASGLMRVTAGSALGRRMRSREMLIGAGPERLARDLGVRVAGRVERADGGVVRTADGAEHRPAAVVWATGYRSAYPWLHAPVLDGAGQPVHARGVTAVPGLYFLGLPWQHTRGSALIGWVGRDAAWLAERIAERAPARTVSRPAAAPA